MNCRPGCAACCVAISISSSIPEMPNGKPAGQRCIQLTDSGLCRLFGHPTRPIVCVSLQASKEMCGTTNTHAYHYLAALEKSTAPAL